MFVSKFLVYHIECIDKWLLRNNRFCPVCKRRVLPGGSDSESEGENTQTENRANEEEDTNESSRLLVDVRSTEDNMSAVTINNNPPDNDLSSMNNQMVTSATMSRELRSSSSRYGSISSMNLAPAMSSKAHENPAYSEQDGSQSDSDRTIESKPKKKVTRHERDTKPSTEFHSPLSSSLESLKEDKPSEESLKASKKSRNAIAHSNSKPKKSKAEKAKSSQINTQNKIKIVEKLDEQSQRSESVKIDLEGSRIASPSSSNLNYLSVEMSDEQPSV